MKACRREATPYTPVWLMRQAGRYMKDYRDVRDKVPFIDLCKNPALAAEVTVTAQERLNVDAAIIFSDILLLVEPMGMKLEYLKGDGPTLAAPIRTREGVEALREVDALRSMGYVMEAIRLTRRSLKPHIPLIGFAGAPFTLASYMIEGGSTKTFQHVRGFMRSDEGLWHELLSKITRATIGYLNAQVDAGAQALQLFDSWVGQLTAEEYRRYVLRHSQELIRGVSGRVPVIHFGTKTGDFLDLMREAGGDVIGADHRVGLAEAWKKIGYDRAIQGNLDPALLLGPVDIMRRQVEQILREAGGRPGHIFNLGHGITPDTPVENVIALVDMVHQLSTTR